MRVLRLGVLALLAPAVGLAQAAPPTGGKPAAATTPTYRGFAPGAPYRDFAERARALARQDVLRCNTSRNTAQLMECGVAIRDPTDGANFYLSSYVLEGTVAMVAFYDSAGFGDARGVPLLDRTKRDLTRRFGRPRPIGKSGWEWSYGRGRKVVRFSWRGRGAGRWVSITLTDNDVMDRIGRYAKTATSHKP